MPDSGFPYERWVTVTRGASGWFAVLMWINRTGEYGNPPFPEPWDTGEGRYVTRDAAVTEAMAWATAEKIPYIPGRLDT